MQITCYDVYGEAVFVPTANLCFRPAVYGIFIEKDHILLTAHEVTKLWHPPGLIIEQQVEVELSLQQYFWQAIRMIPSVVELLWVEEQYRVDAANKAWHLSVLYYEVKRPLATVSTAIKTDQLFAWIPLVDLHRSNMQFGFEAVQAAQRQSLLSG